MEIRSFVGPFDALDILICEQNGTHGSVWDGGYLLLWSSANWGNTKVKEMIFQKHDYTLIVTHDYASLCWCALMLIQCVGTSVLCMQAGWGFWDIRIVIHINNTRDWNYCFQLFLGLMKMKLYRYNLFLFFYVYLSECSKRKWKINYLKLQFFNFVMKIWLNEFVSIYTIQSGPLNIFRSDSLVHTIKQNCMGGVSLSWIPNVSILKYSSTRFILITS